MREPAKSTKYTSKLTQPFPQTNKTPCFKQALCLSCSRNILLWRPVASVTAHTTLETAQHGDLCATSDHRCVQAMALGGGTACQLIEPPHPNHSRGRGDHLASSLRGPREERRPFPGSKEGATTSAHTKQTPLVILENLLSRPPHPPKEKYPDNDGKSISTVKPAGLSGPAHPPKHPHEHSVNSFACDALIGSGNEFNDCNKKYSIYKDRQWWQDRDHHWYYL